MSLLINGAGVSAADPILDGLGIKLTFGTSSFDVATVNDAFIDQASGFPGGNSVKANLSPASSVITAGTTGGFTDSTDQYNIGDTTGLSAGDAIYLSHASITDGIYFIASVVDGTDVTITGNPLNGAGDQSNVFYQVAWSWEYAAGTSPSSSNGSGVQNYFKADAEDSGGNNTELEDSFYLRDAPSGSSFIAIDGGDYTGGSGSDTGVSLGILSSWANNGGVAYVEMANHSVQSVNNFTWQTGGGTGEKTLAQAIGGLIASGGDGVKYGRLVLKSASGSSLTVGVDIDFTVDTSGPTLTMEANAA